MPPRATIAPPAALPLANPPLYGPLELAPGDDEGPANGLTLDQAIDRLVRENLDLRSRYFEIPQADADILTASLRANPLLYFDSQLVPYGQYSNTRPGGPVQYDLNITHPFDLSRKRQARIRVAVHAKHVLEAQYQNAVRLQIANLYTAYVDVLAARETIRFRQQSIIGLKKLYEVTAAKHKLTGLTSADLAQVEGLRNSAEIGLAEDLEALRRARWVLASLLSMPPAEGDQLMLRGSIRDYGIEPPDENALWQAAYESRPDLAAQRLGITRAQADVELAKRNRFQDVYMLYQPYTFQNGQPFGTKSSTSWALGVTVPLPLYNRNQGNILRNQLNVTQTQTELAALERQVMTEVIVAAREFAISRATVQNIEKKILPPALKRAKDTRDLYLGGEEMVDVVTYLNAQRDYNEYVRQYREALVRHRRSMLNLNTVVGQRIMP